MSCTNATNIFIFGLMSGIASDIRASSIDQQQLMTFAYAFSVTLMTAFAILSNILSIDTFYQAQIRTTTVGLYLIVYSCCSLFAIIMLECRLTRLLNTFTYTTSFILCNILAGLTSIFTRICLWLNGFIALQRSLHSFEPNRLLNMIRSRSAAKKQIIVILIVITLMHIHELIYRVSVPDPVLKVTLICQIKYPPSLLTLNTIFSIIHLFVPFSLNMLSNCLLLTSISRRRATLHQTPYWIQWMRHFRYHRHLFLAPTFTMICILPQLILSLVFSCVNISTTWLLRSNIAANLIIYLPQAATFLVFILPSESYLDVFRTQSHLGKLFFRCCRRRNIVVPATAIIDQAPRWIRNKNPPVTIELHQQPKIQN